MVPSLDIKLASLDNENPRHEIFLENYTISNKLISISEWLAFVRENGYKRKKFWSSHGWGWRTKNNINSPMNWVFKNKWSERKDLKKMQEHF